MAHAREHREEMYATERTRLLTEMHQSKGSAVALCYNNKRNVEMAELMRVSDNFDRWRQQKDRYRQIGAFTVISGEAVEGAAPTSLIRFTIEGNQYRVKVPKDQTITWVD